MDRYFYYFFSAAFAVNAAIIDSRPEVCDNTGYICSEDCRSLLYCPSALGTAYVISDCGEHDKFCDSENVACSDKPCKRKRSFLCTSTNTFPDPYDCSVSYFCTKEGGPPQYRCQCPENMYFDTKNGDCKQGFCPRASEPQCTKPTEVKAFKDDNRYYYVCTEKLALVFKCQDGYIYKNDACEKSENSGNNGNTPDLPDVDIPSVVVNVTNSRRLCDFYSEDQDNLNASTLPSVSTSSTESSSQGTTPTTHQPESSTDPTYKPIGQCHSRGDLLADQECDHYWLCDNYLKAQRRKCPEGTHFNDILKGCDIGKC